MFVFRRSWPGICAALAIAGFGAAQSGGWLAGDDPSVATATAVESRVPARDDAAIHDSRPPRRAAASRAAAPPRFPRGAPCTHPGASL